MPVRDPDELLVVIFKHLAIQNNVRTLAEGRPVFDDVEVCEIRAPGSKDVKVFPATAFARWVDNPYTGEQTKQTYAERFSQQYRQFKAHATQTKSGTPLDFAPFLTEGRRAELRAQNVYTVEQLAAIEGVELKNLGPGGRTMKNDAEAFIADSRSTAPNMQLLAELEALKARNAILEEDFERRQATRQAKPKPDDDSATDPQLQAKIDALKARNNALAPDAEFEEMTLEQLRDYVTVHSGQQPHGALNRRTLVRMAQNVRPEKAT